MRNPLNQSQMALYDNKYWLLSHIRNSFLSTDDTGMCELIMAGEEGVRKQLKQRFDCYPDEEDSEDEDDLSHESYDLQLDTDFGMRYRSNTQVRLEKLDVMRKKSAKMKHVKWEAAKTPLSTEQLDELFVRKPMDKSERTHSRSLLTETFKKSLHIPTNPYIEYSKFDGSGQVSSSVKKYKIFLTVLSESHSHRNYPVHISCVNTAKIHELIGLILLKCSTSSKFEDCHFGPVHNYGLYITEEDGEVDHDFPHLDPTENISKFGFTCLGLVEHGDVKSLDFEDSRNNHKPLETQSERKLKELAKINEERQTTSDLHTMDCHTKQMQAPLYRSYRVYLMTKMRTKAEMMLGVSGEKIELDPVPSKQNLVALTTLVKQKPISHPMDAVAWCEMVETRGSRATFRIVYTTNESGSLLPQLHNSTSFKSYDFECDPVTAQEIVNQISLILNLRSSETMKEYMASQERKRYKKKSFNLNK